MMKNNFYLFFVFGITARIFPFLLLPIIIKQTNDEQLANFMLFVSTSSFLGALFLFGTQFELTRVFFTNKKKLKLIVFNSTLVILALGITISSGLFFSSFDRIYFYGSINALFISLISYLLVYYRISESVIKFGVVDILRVAIQYLVVLFLLLIDNFSIALIVLSNIIWVLLVIFIELYSRKINIIRRGNYKEIKNLTNKGVKILPHNISIFGLMLLDKIILKEYSTDTILAQYSIGFMVGQLIILATDAFNKVWGPYAIKTIEEGGRTILIRKTKKIAIISVLLSPIVALSIFFLSAFYFPDGYELARKVASLVSFIFLIQILYFLIFPFLIHADEVGKIGVISAISAIIGASGMLLFIFLEMYYLLPVGILLAFMGQIIGILIVLNRKKNND